MLYIIEKAVPADKKPDADASEEEKNDYGSEAFEDTDKSMTRRANYTVALKDSLAHNAYIAGYDAEVASVAVMNGDLLLMGKRRDNGKWTLPGGHLNPGEDPHAGGLRELFEESGIQAHALTTLGQRGVLTNDGRFIMVHAYYLPVETKVTTKLDPDQEIVEWRWFKTTNGLPKYVQANLHVTRNFVLNCLGLQKSATFGVKEPGLHGGHIVRYTRSGRPVYAHHEARINKFKKKKPKLADTLIGQAKAAIKFLTGKSVYFIEEMMKSEEGSVRPGHKYLRRYKRPDGSWGYVYHEGDAHGRAVPEEAVHTIKKLADLGDEHARALHSTLQDHDPEKLNILRELGDHGDQEAVHHLKRLGIDHAEDKQQREAAEVERALLAERNSNPLVKPLEGAELQALHTGIRDAVGHSVFEHLRQHTGTVPATRLREAGVTLDTVMEPVRRETTITGALKALHESLKAIDTAHTGVVSQNQDAVRVGGYANLAWNRTLQVLSGQHIIPEAMSRELVVNSSTSSPTTRAHAVVTMDPGRHAAAARGLADQRRQEAERRAREAAERQAREERERQARQEREERERRERQEREERERREHAEALAKHQESIDDMARYFGATIAASEHPRLAGNIQRWFGADFKFKNFVKHLNPDPESKTELKIGHGFLDGMRHSRDSFDVNFDVIEKRTGQRITAAHRGVYKGPDGSIHWSNGSFSRASNEFLKKYPGMARGLYMGVERFLKEVTANWTGPAKENTKITIGSCANSGFGNGYKGALVWAKHCFDWSGGTGGSASGWRRTWGSYIDRYARTLGMPAEQARELKAKIDAAEYPHQFVNTGFVLDRAQALQIVGRLDFDFEQIFANKGYCDIGDLIMIDSGTSWSGLNYINRTTGRAGELNRVRTAYYDGTAPRTTPVRIQGGTTPAPAAPAPSAPATPPRATSPPSTSAPSAPGSAAPGRIRSDIVFGWMRTWPRRNAAGQTRITISAKRLQRMLRQSDEVVREFMHHAGPMMTPAQRRRIRAAFQAAGRSL